MRRILGILGGILLILALCVVCTACNDRQPTVGFDSAVAPNITGDIIIPGETDDPIETDDPVETDASIETDDPVETDDPTETDAPVETDPDDGHRHSWTEWTVTESAGCTSPGKRVRKCDSCSETETKDIPVLGHNIVNHDGKEATCTEAGWNTYANCVRCEYTTYEEIKPLGHDKVSYEAKAPECGKPGWSAYEACARCDYTTYEELPTPDHVTVSHEGKAVTCTEDGWKPYVTCKNCDYTTYAMIKAPGHKYVSHNAKSPTCVDVGWDAYEVCSGCELTTYSEIKALGHDIVNHEGKAATCGEGGWDPYETCSRCDYSTYRPITPKNHKIVEHEAKAPTCTDHGWEAYETCENCAYTTYKQISPRHDKIYVSAKEPTCTEKGWSAYEMCRNCDYNDYYEKAPLGHDEVTHEAKAPTCSNIGWNPYVTCSRCDYSTYAEKPKLAHSFSNGACSACGASEFDVSWYDESKREFTITTLDQLKGLASLVNKGNTFANKIIYLGKDISVNGEEWTPIGAEYGFVGIFDGCGHTVSNYKITDPKYTYVGLFGRIEGYGEIRNLKVAASSISVTAVDDNTGCIYIGGIAAKGYGIVNCTADVDITYNAAGLAVEGGGYVGGIMGYGTNGYIQNSVANGDVRVIMTGQGKWANTLYVGGAAGYVSRVSESGADGNVYVESYMHKARCGGLIGELTSEASRSSAAGGVTVKCRGEVNVGGLIGYCDGGRITDCYAVGDVNGSSDNNTANVGGLAGYYYSYSSIYIRNCYAVGNVSAYGKSEVFAGGLCGYCYGLMDNVTNCYSAGNVRAESSSANVHTGSVSGKETATFNCYSSAAQTITMVIKGKTETGPTYANRNQTVEKELSELHTVSFLKDTLRWSEEVWSLSDGSAPKLK